MPTNTDFTDVQLEALFYDSSDALHVCVDSGDYRGAEIRLRSMMALVRELKTPEQPTNHGASTRIPGWRYVEESL